jgi:hypothetical protein
MLVVGMLFAVLVLGPLLILAMLAVASNERAVAWLRRVTGQPHGGTGADERMPNITPDAPVDASPDDAARTTPDPTQQSA